LHHQDRRTAHVSSAGAPSMDLIFAAINSPDAVHMVEVTTTGPTVEAARVGHDLDMPREPKAFCLETPDELTAAGARCVRTVRVLCTVDATLRSDSRAAGDGHASFGDRRWCAMVAGALALDGVNQRRPVVSRILVSSSRQGRPAPSQKATHRVRIGEQSKPAAYSPRT
jgi:hypothetical protein